MQFMPRLVYLLPLSALFIAALSLFISPAGAITYARLVGGPTEQASFHGRVQVLREETGVVQPAASFRFVVDARQGEQVTTLERQTDADGWAEIFVPRMPERPLSLRVLSQRGATLAEGAVHLARSSWLRAATRRRSNFRAHEHKDLRVCMNAPSVVFAVPFEQPLLVHVGRPQADLNCRSGAVAGLPGVSIALEITGGLLRGPSTCQTDAAGTCRFNLRPFHHQASAHLDVRLWEMQFQFEESLPVVPGALGITLPRPGEGAVQVVSPIVRDHVWYSLVSEHGRGRGGRLDLSVAQDGTARGQLSVSEQERRGAFLVLSSDADGPSSSAVGYPLDGQEHTLDAWDANLLDGTARAKRQAARRTLRVRVALGLYCLVTIVLSVALFWSEVRREQAEVDRRMTVSGVPNAVGTSTTPLIVAVLCVFFAFSATLVWIVTR